MMELKESFATRFEKALSLKDIRPVDLAKKVGISEATISQYRSGYSKPKENRLVAIANALGIDPGWLMGLDVPMLPRKKQEGESGNMAERESLYLQEIDDIANQLTEENKKRLLAYARKLYDLQQTEEELK